MLLKRQIRINYLDCERTVHIYVPDNRKNFEKFPVLYMFDGHNLFLDNDATYGKSWGLKDYLEKNDIRIIVAGIECNHEGNQRICEFSPYDFNDENIGCINGTGVKFMDFMVNELKPFIDKNFPTKKDKLHTYLAGSSMGGLMALYGVTKYNDIYSACGAISPFTLYIDKKLEKDLIVKSQLDRSIFYISVGTKEFDSKRALESGCEELLKLSRLLTKKGAKVYTHLNENGYHNESSWEKELPIMFNELEIN